MKIRWIIIILSLTLLYGSTFAQSFNPTPAAGVNTWPSDLPWWKRNNLRVMQTNLPAYEAQLNVDSLIVDLEHFSVNTLIINGGGIMAFYDTQLENQYTNPYMQAGMLHRVIEECHKRDIRVITRFDFSRFHESIFEKHPDWGYISPKGDRITNDDMYVASINAPYVQEMSVKIVEEVMDSFPIDGIFINMPGYHTRNAYEGIYYGIDQNEHDKARFKEWSGGLTLPTEENANDPVFVKYQEFKAFTADDWIKKIHDAVKNKNPHTAICTYMDDYVDIIRHESQTHGLPYFPYNAYDNVTSAGLSHPDHIVSNASIQQISFQSRYNAIEPEETIIRLAENLAAGSGLDMSLMGDFRDYEDERNFPAWEAMYAHHKKYEPYFGHYTSPAEICIISPGYWPGGTTAEEYRGIQLMLKESHLPFDIIEAEEILELKERLSDYQILILPQIENLPEASIAFLKELMENGTTIIGTNQTLHQNREGLLDLFGAKVKYSEFEGSGYYLNPRRKQVWNRFQKQQLLFWKYNLGKYDFTAADEKLLPIYTPGRPGPPEKIGGHQYSGYHAVAIKAHGKGAGVLLPINLGRLYYRYGYEQHKNILLDLIDITYPEAYNFIQTDAHERVEIVPQYYTENLPKNIDREEPDGLIIHLINLTGFSGNTYFSPLEIENIHFRVRLDFTPKTIYSMVKEKEIPFTYENGYILFNLDHFAQFDGLIIPKE